MFNPNSSEQFLKKSSFELSSFELSSSVVSVLPRVIRVKQGTPTPSQTGFIYLNES